MTDRPIDFEENRYANVTNGPRRLRPAVLWLGVLGLVILFIPLTFMSILLSNQADRLASEVESLQTLVESGQGLPQEQVLSVTLTAVSQQTDQMTQILPTLAAENVDWAAIMPLINNVDADAIRISSLEQVGNQLFIRGRAANDDTVTQYAQQLESSGQFAQVVVQTIVPLPEPFLSPTPTVVQSTAVPPTTTPTSTPTSTPKPTSVPMATWTPTPKLTDDYEWDDTTPKPIFLGTPSQLHNFYPNFDVDHVTFLAKMGRSYEISTDFLAPGVDTLLTVTVGDTTLTNDDAALGLLSSSVIMQAPADSDVEVLVQVSNRGVYGADKWYDLLVEEVIPTTPTATQTPTTAVPTVTPSATADLRDIYEPNDIDPNPIAVGETQIHNFYPSGDVDKVEILVKNGRFYQILTSQLAVGVDTAVTVDFNGESWQNDDYDLPGSDNFASAVCFPAEVDGTAVATISNVGQQFAPSKTYIVTVQEVPFLTVDPEALDFGTLIEASGNPPSQTLQIEGSEPLDWAVMTETTWLSTDIVTGTTPTTLTITADISGLAVGLHKGEITLGWADFCRQTIPVTLQIDPVVSFDFNGRSLFAAKAALFQDEAVEFVIAV
ncbi:hypothetical protein MNBD_CHLOROFLEXI01-5347, partial [hydrothermal vent metagenome]